MKQRLLYSLLVLIFLGAVSNGYSQKISSLAPASALPTGQKIDIVITGSGTNFKSRITQANFGDGITVQNPIVVQNSFMAIATIIIDPNAQLGKRTITVVTDNEVATFIDGFEVFQNTGVLRASIEVSPVQSINLSDLDPSQLESAPFFFNVNVYNDNTVRKLIVEVNLKSDLIGYLGKAYTPATAFNPNQYIRFSRKEFTKFKSSLQGSDFYKKVLATGSFPPDNYTYTVNIIDASTNKVVFTEEQSTTVANNKYNPELILPGANFSMPLQEVITAFPLFQWYGQNDRYDFRLYMVMPGQSAEEAARNIPVYKKDDMQETNLLYPNFAEKLIDGKQYAWQVIGKVSSIKGTQQIPSEMFTFIYKSVVGGAIGGLNTEPNAPQPLDSKIGSLKVSPPQLTLQKGQQFQFVATAYDANNQFIKSPQITWSLSPISGGTTIDKNGLITIHTKGGTFAVIAKAGNITDFATVTVNEVSVPASFNTEDWLIETMIKKTFGMDKPSVPNKNSTPKK